MPSIKLRDVLKKNSALISMVSLVLIVGAIIAMVLQDKGHTPRGATLAYFYDASPTNTDEPMSKLFPAPLSEDPPVRTPWGPSGADAKPTGVRAYVFSCGSCSKDMMFIGYLETYDNEAKEALKKMRARNAVNDPSANSDLTVMETINKGHLIGEKDGQTWYPFSSPEAQQVMDAARKNCGEGTVIVDCLP